LEKSWLIFPTSWGQKKFWEKEFLEGNFNPYGPLIRVSKGPPPLFAVNRLKPKEIRV